MDLKKIEDKELRKKIESFKENISKEAEDLVMNYFPKKCIELDTMLKEDYMQLDKTADIVVEVNLPIPEPIINNHIDTDLAGPGKKKRKVADNNASDGDHSTNSQCSGSKVFQFTNGSVPCNVHLLKIINVLKPEVRLLVEKCNTVRMWVTLLIPKIEDGNNFGVSIQEETLSELRQVESESASFLDQISKYFFTRGQIVAKAAKYPHVGDYRQFITELDEKEFLSLRLIASELRNHYSVLHDMIIKNIEKIKKPRNVNIDGMY